MRAFPQLRLRFLASLALPALIACADSDRGSILGPSALLSAAGAPQGLEFTVNSLTKALYTYASGSNHDPDGSSNGTTIKVNKP